MNKLVGHTELLVNRDVDELGRFWLKICLLAVFFVLIFPNVNHAQHCYRSNSAAAEDWDSGSAWERQVNCVGGWAASGDTPGADDNVTIQTGHIRELDSDESVFDLVVETGATFRMSTANDDITVADGGSITTSGTANFEENGQTDVTIITLGDATITHNGGTFSIDDLVINGAGTITIEGSGTYSFLNDIILSNGLSGVTLNLNGSDIDLSGSILLSTGANSNTINVGVGADINASGTGSYLHYQGTTTDNNTVNINGTLTFVEPYLDSGLWVEVSDASGNVMNVGSTGKLVHNGTFEFSDSDYIINNSGIIDFNHTFTQFAGNEQVNNLNGGIFKWGFISEGAIVQTTTDYSALTLNCDDNYNTFEYDGAGDQDCIIPTDGEYNTLTASGSGTKFTDWNPFIILDSLNIRGSAIFDPTTGADDIELGGHFTNSSSIVDAFLEGTTPRRFTFNGSGNQIIHRSTGGTLETFADFFMDKSSGTLSINSASDVTITNELELESTGAAGAKFLIDHANITVTVNEVVDINQSELEITDGLLFFDKQSATDWDQDGGTVDVQGGEVRLGDQVNDGNTDYNLDAGTLLLSGTGTLNISDEFDMDGGTTTISGGTLNVKTISGAGSGTGVAKLSVDGGTFNMSNGDIYLMGANSAAAGTPAMHLNSAATTNITGGTIHCSETGANDENFYIRTDGHSIYNLNIEKSTGGATTVFLYDDIDINGNLTIDNGSTLNVTEGAGAGTEENINLAGNWDNNNTVAEAGFEEGTATVTFDGTSAQTIDHDGNEQQFYDLTIDKSGGASQAARTVTIQDDVLLDIGDDLTIQNTSWLTNVDNEVIEIAGDWDNNNASAGDGFTPNTGRVDFDGTTAQTIDQTGNEQDFYDVDISNTSANVTIIGGTKLDVGRDILIDNNATLATTTNEAIELTRHWTNDNTVASAGFNANTGTVTLDGITQQAITHAGGTETYYNLVVNNSVAGTAISLADIVSVSNQLTLTDGVVTPAASQYLEMTSVTGGNLTAHNSGSFINGKLRRYVNNSGQAYAFPVGNGTAITNYYLAEFYDYNQTGVTYIDGEFIALAGHSDGDMTEREVDADPNTQYVDLCSDGVWDLSPNPAATPAGLFDLRLYLANFSGCTLSDNQFGILHRASASVSGADWSCEPCGIGDPGLPVTDAAGMTTASGYALRQGMSSFSQKGIGTTFWALPVELVAFDATAKENNTVEVTWETTMELNNDYFTVERSIDNEHFEEVGEIEGAGNSSKNLSYLFVDENPHKGYSYYRLSQTDFDGSSETFNSKAVFIGNKESIGVNNDNDVILFPNPIGVNEDFNLQVFGIDADGEEVLLVVTDVLGKVVYTKTHILYNEKYETVNIASNNNISSGIYTIVGSSKQILFNKKLIVK